MTRAEVRLTLSQPDYELPELAGWLTAAIAIAAAGSTVRVHELTVEEVPEP